MQPRTEICQWLEWDSNFFGRQIARLNIHRLEPALIPQIMDWCSSRQIDCLYFLADADHVPTAELAARHGFQFVDIRLTLERPCPTQALAPPKDPALQPNVVRPYQPADLPTLRELASGLHPDSRFFVDTHFPEQRSRGLFATWIEKNCCDPQGAVFVAPGLSADAGALSLPAPPQRAPSPTGKILGYITARRADEHTGQIDLLGVAAEARGQGLGRELIAVSLDWMTQKGFARAIVITQGRNVPAQRLYQRCGFVTRSLQLWYHRWSNQR